MAPRPARVYTPTDDNRRQYDLVYREYKRMYDHFGRGGNDVMKVLRGMRRR